MRLEKQSPCKVNLLLNILGRRADGFHELETVLQPVDVCDEMTFERRGNGIQLSCSHTELPVDSRNLVCRAAASFLAAAKISDGVRVHLQKNLPLAGGIGGGSANAAVTFSALNELFGAPLPPEKLHQLAADIGSDVPFFLHRQPALATGRGEKVQLLEDFPVLRDRAILLIHPGFGISTPWSYQNLARFPKALNGQRGRAQKLISLLQSGSAGLQPAGFKSIAAEFYNSLEAPAFDKFPVLALFQEFLRENGALATLMSGSGSTTFALVENVAAGESLVEKFKSKFGQNCWTAVTKI